MRSAALHRHAWSSPCRRIEPVRLLGHIVTRGLDHTSRIYPTCALKFPNSGKSEFGWSIIFAKKMDGRGLSAFSRVFCRAKPGHDGASCLEEILRRSFDYTPTTLLTTHRAYARAYAAWLIEGVF